MSRFATTLLASLAMVIVFSLACFGQTTAVSGTVMDPSGAVVPGALVTLTNKETDAVRTGTTSSAGEFTFAQVTPGMYSVKAEKQGFKTVVLENMEVLINTAPRISVKFREVGSVSETVVVSSEGAVVNTTDATLGNAFGSLQVRDLPLSARNVVGLLSLQPGVTQSGSVNGGRFDQANVTLDGVDVNDQDSSGRDSHSGQAFYSVLRVTPDSLEEFRVTTTNANADQGRSSGAQIALVTKSGTNQFHGTLYEYNRLTSLTANDWFNNKASVARPELIRNNFGGSIGGPIKKDKLFFFFNYEGFREAKGSSVVREVPLASLGAGVARYKSADGAMSANCPTGATPGVMCVTAAQMQADYMTANGVNPGANAAGIAFLNSAAGKYVSNDTTTGDLLNTGGYRFNASTPTKQTTMVGKIDYNLSSKHLVSFRANYQNDNSLGSSYFADTASPTVWGHPRGLQAGDTWTVKNTLINTFRYGYTRDAVSSGGDSGANSVVFRFIFQPVNFSRTSARTTPVHNFVDDLSWTKGKHQIGAGINFRMISNARDAFSNSYDSLTTNPSGYQASGKVLYQATSGGAAIFPDVASSWNVNVEYAMAAMIGRYSQYTASLVYGASGALQPVGTGVARTFNTQEYEGYLQDSWRVKPNLTLTYGVRWTTDVPVYEANGFEVTPTVGLSDYFANRIAGAAAGTPYNAPITIGYAGPSYGKPGFYPQQWANLGPSASFAYQPAFKSGPLAWLFGDHKSSIRGGYRLTYDHFGEAVAVAFDLNNTLGFTSADTIPVNTYNVTNHLGPLFTSLGQDARSLPGLSYASSVAFPLLQPSDGSRRIESSLDSNLTTPYNHSINFTIGRQLPKGFTMDVSYVGRFARNLLTQRDIMQPSNFTDPKSGVSWYNAINALVALRNQNTPVSAIQNMPYFQDLFASLAGNYKVLGVSTPLSATQAAYLQVARTAQGGQNSYDYTTVQDNIEGNGSPASMFYSPQYGALDAFSTFGYSNYNAMQVSVRKGLSKNLTMDFNYTWSKSIDLSSGAQNTGNYGSAFVLNALYPNQSRADSSFDLRHQVNINYLYNLPFGHGQKWGNNLNPVVDTILGGWRTTGIFRVQSGLPSGQPFDSGVWATNWEISSNSVAVQPVASSPTRTGDPNLFSNPTGVFDSYRNSLAGESGDRNVLRYPAQINMDLGVYKEFPLKFKESAKLTFRAEAFNVANHQIFTGISSFAVSQDPNLLGTAAPVNFGKFTGTVAGGRVMQMALRIDF